MKRKGLLFVCVAVPAIAGSILLINRFASSMPDWVVRTTGIILMAGLILLGFVIARGISEKKVTD